MSEQGGTCPFIAFVKLNFSLTIIILWWDTLNKVIVWICLASLPFIAFYSNITLDIRASSTPCNVTQPRDGRKYYPPYWNLTLNPLSFWLKAWFFLKRKSHFHPSTPYPLHVLSLSFFPVSSPQVLSEQVEITVLDKKDLGVTLQPAKSNF